MDQITQFQSTNPSICLSGGAEGADMEWGTAATQAGHAVLHWTFPTHRSRASEAEQVRLSDAQLEIAIPFVKSAAKGLRKSPPRANHVWRLIHRNYYQVAWAESCYAVTVIQEPDSGKKIGGTAWATTMFAQMHPEGRRMWIFDQAKDAWYWWKGDVNGREWERMEGRPPKPEGRWAGIGSRELGENGRRAIRELLEVEG